MTRRASGSEIKAVCKKQGAGLTENEVNRSRDGGEESMRRVAFPRSGRLSEGGEDGAYARMVQKGIGPRSIWTKGLSDIRCLRSGTYCVKDFLTRYGYDLPVEGNIPGTMEEWGPKNRKEGLVGEELAKENDFQENERKALHSKLANWYRHRFNGKRLHSAGVEKILRRMQAMSGNAARPRRKTNLTLYLSKYYVSKLKQGFDAIWDNMKETLPSSVRISMCQDYVRACWEQESEEVKTEIAVEADTQYEAEMGEYRSMKLAAREDGG
ncbi:hypothetical protein B0H14DRAFT_2589927 [Mycena olivaceomarginata]|nr:hypothetical protein B0H14DRAFT_2589927 [Mycena olivaceomarginata]